MTEHRHRTRVRLILGAWAVLLAVIAHWIIVPPAPSSRIEVLSIAAAPAGSLPRPLSFTLEAEGTPARVLISSSSGGFPGSPLPIEAAGVPEELGSVGMIEPWRSLLDEIAPDRVVGSEFESSRTWEASPKLSDHRVHGRSVLFRSSPDGPWQCAFGAALAPEGRLPTTLPIFLVTLDDFPADRVPRHVLHYRQVEMSFLGRRLGRTPHRISVSFSALRKEAAIQHDLPIEFLQGVDLVPSLPPGQG